MLTWQFSRCGTDTERRAGKLLIPQSPEMLGYLTEKKKGEVEDYIKEHLPGDQGEAVKVA